MTDNGKTIALIASSFVAQLIASWFAAFVGRPRNNQPAPTPEPNQPKNRPQRINGWFMRLAVSPWVTPPLFILIYIYGLLEVFRETRPVTRGVILEISILVGGIFWAVGQVDTRLIWRAILRQNEIEDRLLDNEGRLLEQVGELSNIATTMAESAAASTQPAPGALDKFLCTMRKL